MAVSVYAKSLETGTNRSKFCCLSLILVYIHPHNHNFFFSQEAQTELKSNFSKAAHKKGCGYVI